jgi:hypothetical protein
MGLTDTKGKNEPAARHSREQPQRRSELGAQHLQLVDGTVSKRNARFATLDKRAMLAFPGQENLGDTGPLPGSFDFTNTFVHPSLELVDLNKGNDREDTDQMANVLRSFEIVIEVGNIAAERTA